MKQQQMSLQAVLDYFFGNFEVRSNF